MDDNARRRFESLEALRLAAYTSFSDRRTYEWKLSLSIWTAQALLCAGLLQPVKAGEVFPFSGSTPTTVAAIVAAAVAVLHAFWSHQASRAHHVDKAIMLHWLAQMNAAVGGGDFDADLKSLLTEHKPRHGWYRWSHLAQILITVLLGLVAVGIVWARTH